jgi:hypothetical protein
MSKEGFDTYLNKPINQSALRSSLLKVTGILLNLGTLFEMLPKIERDFILIKAHMDEIL